MSALARVLILYNTDYDAELIAATDVSAVRTAAEAVAGAVAEAGFTSELMGIHGFDLGDVIAQIRAWAPDLVFNLCESLSGDARNEFVMPAVLDMLGLRYTGTSALSLGMCLHKHRAKAILRGCGVATPHAQLLTTPRDLAGPLSVPYPCFLKPAHEDASIGIKPSNRVTCRRDLVARARELFERYRQPVLAEHYIDGREVNVTLLGNDDDIEVLPLHEIDFSAMPPKRAHVVSYAAKWDESHAEYAGTVPVPMHGEPVLQGRVAHVATSAFRALGVRDFGRVDVRIDNAGRPWVIDVNPNCDISPDSGVVRAAAGVDLDYVQLIGRICQIAWNRYENSPHHRR